MDMSENPGAKKMINYAVERTPEINRIKKVPESINQGGMLQRPSMIF
jgi:hypothetical protein